MAFRARTRLLVQKARKNFEMQYYNSTESTPTNINELPLMPYIKYETTSYFNSSIENASDKEVALKRLQNFCNGPMTVIEDTEKKLVNEYDISEEDNTEFDIEALYSPCDDSDADKNYQPSGSSSESEKEEETQKRSNKKRKILSELVRIDASENVEDEGNVNNNSSGGNRDKENETTKRFSMIEKSYQLESTENNMPGTSGTSTKKKKCRRTEQEKVEHGKLKHPMRNLCSGKCKRDCTKLSDEDRNKIWDHYWNLNYTSRRKWLSKHVSLVSVKRRILSASRNRSESRRFSLPLADSKDVQVCRLTFLNTLGYTNDSVITELVRAIKKKPCGEMVKECRGNHKKAIDPTFIKAHIESFHPFVSHYRRKNAPLRRYLSRELTIDKLYNDFNEKNPNTCKVETYRKVLKDMNISMCPPKSDVCEECETMENDDDDQVRQKLHTHKLRAAKATSQYKKDAEEASTSENATLKRTFSMDLQKVMLLPIMPACKSSFFISRLVIFNETFATLNKESRKKSYCVLWHEALAGRKAEAIADSILKLMNQERDATEFLFWADNCTAQNKNWVLFTTLVNAVNLPTGPNKITIRYLTKGHTHMSADGIHGNIERKIGRKRTITDFQELVEVIQACRKNVDVLQLTEFHLWQNKKRITRKPDDPLKGFLIGELVEVTFCKGSRNIKYKLDFGGEEKELDFLQKKVNLPIVPEILPARGISASKKEKICKVLVPLMPLNRRIFWESLPESQGSLDLLNAEQNIESPQDDS
ncbi:unnamed protein product [Ceutorhynchus assimilis]|uniref:DUF7869 domain-containing protein n=1 Tax=Ceutorhynchus assimilis TaxID=467358 RepID=A0A9N9MUN8_9CUCU|nr:unnamed protein product [Ceutorhynchus assimilis]